MLAAPRRLGSIRVPACGVRRLAEQGFPAGRRKLHAGTRGSESRSAATRSRDALPRPIATPVLVFQRGLNMPGALVIGLGVTAALD